MELADWQKWWKRSGAADLRRILIEEWDPIGVRGVPEAADEYDSYLPQIGSRLRDGATKDEIATYLTWVEEDRMGLGPSNAARARNQALAARLCDWYAEAMAAQFAPGTIQLPFHTQAEADDAANMLSAQGYEVRVIAWVDGWWVTSIDGPIERLRSESDALMAAWDKAQRDPGS